MAGLGWAFVNCTASGETAGQAAGPTGSLQFLTGTNASSGSAFLLYHTAAYSNFAASTLVLTGTLIVEGTVTASSFVVEQTDVISGSTIFGNDSADYHIRTGSMHVGPVGAGKGHANFEVTVAGDLAGQVRVDGFRVAYNKIVATNLTTSLTKMLYGVTAAGEVVIRIHSASVAGSGSLMTVKDQQVASRGGDSIILSASKGGPGNETIDGADYYELTGTMPAISLYSDGANWFVY